MYKVAYKSNIFGKVMIEKFKDEKSAIGGVKKLKNKYYILYADTDMSLYYGWTGKAPKTILGSFSYSILYPSVTEWEIFKIEQPDLYKSIRWYFYINPIAFICYVGLILAWFPTGSAPFTDRVLATIALLICFRFLRHELETSVMKKLCHSIKMIAIQEEKAKVK